MRAVMNMSLAPARNIVQSNLPDFKLLSYNTMMSTMNTIDAFNYLV